MDSVQALRLYPEVDKLLKKYHMHRIIFIDSYAFEANFQDQPGFVQLINKPQMSFSACYLDTRAGIFTNGYVVAQVGSAAGKSITDNFAASIMRDTRNFLIDVKRRRRS